MIRGTAIVVLLPILAAGFAPEGRALIQRQHPTSTRSGLPKTRSFRIVPTLFLEASNQDSFDVSSEVSASDDSDTQGDQVKGVNGDLAGKLSNKPPFPIVVWKFTRPHTLIGSALAIPALHMYAASSLTAALSKQNMLAMLYAMLPSLLMNLYITGLNQVTDVAIDKINKPNLPIPAGILKRSTAIVTCIVALVASLTLGAIHPVFGSQGLNVTLWGSCILGTMYSLKPFRLKRFPLFAAICIVAVRGTVVNAGFYTHATVAGLGDTSATFLSCLLHDRRCSLSTVFFGIFGLVIALMKDVPDVLGDRLSNVRTFSVRVGPKRIFLASRAIVMALFWSTGAGFFGLAATGPKSSALQRCLVGASSILAGLSMRSKAKIVDPESPSMVYNYYMHMWKLFYLSYLVLPFAR